MRRKPVLLLLPCTNKKPYAASSSWRFVLNHVGRYRDTFDVAAVDCITNRRTGKPFGIVHERQQRLVVGRDERPDPEKLDDLVVEIEKKLARLAPRYEHIIAYLNVKTYWRAIEKVQDQFNITMLPKAYRGRESWNSHTLHMGPIGMFKKSINQLEKEIEANSSRKLRK
jgi:predicted RNA-binding protein